MYEHNLNIWKWYLIYQCIIICLLPKTFLYLVFYDNFQANELTRNAIIRARQKELETFQRALDIQWLNSRMEDGRMGRCLALIKKEAEMEKDFQEVPMILFKVGHNYQGKTTDCRWRIFWTKQKIYKCHSVTSELKFQDFKEMCVGKNIHPKQLKI